MLMIGAISVAVLGTLSKSVRNLVGTIPFVICWIITLLILFGMTLP
jgi:hypothetical protein